MSDREGLGEFEHIIILALLRLGDEAYGMRVRQEIEQRAGRETSIGAVYSTLDRLEIKGLVQSNTADPTPERGGRAKRIFRATPKGIQALERSQQALMNMMEGLTWKA
jgi:PadR family transcriptional regulator PadR